MGTPQSRITMAKGSERGITKSMPPLRGIEARPDRPR